MQSPKVGKAPLRVLDLIRFNKDYKVYNNTIHFYNSLYEILVNKNTYPLLAHETLTFKLTTREDKNGWITRSFPVELSTIYRGLERNDLLIETELFNCTTLNDRSQLAINIVKSRSSISLRGL
jgi:hypothetical protein